MVFSNDRRKERRVRWLLFLVVAGIWSALIWSANPALAVSGICVAALTLLQVWNNSPRIPVLAYHSISDHPDWLGKSELSVSPGSLDLQLQWLVKKGYQSLRLDDFLLRQAQGTLPRNAVVITFDDGYLDNWVAAEPLLRKYGLCGTVYVSSRWIEEGCECRPQSDQADSSNIRWHGYLNAAEIKALADGNTLDVQSHAASHDRLFCSDEIKGFVTPQNRPRWLEVLQKKKKYNWYKPGDELPIGYPIFASGEALAVPRFYPDPDLVTMLTGIASNTSLTVTKDWQNKLLGAAHGFRASNNTLGKMESAAQTTERWRKELSDSKTILESVTHRPVRHLCWPRDAYCKDTMQLASEVGYETVTGGTGSNQSLNDTRQLSRFYVEDCGIPRLDLVVFVLQMWLFRGRVWAWPLSALGNRVVRLLQRTGK